MQVSVRKTVGRVLRHPVVLLYSRLAMLTACHNDLSM